MTTDTADKITIKTGRHAVQLCAEALAQRYRDRAGSTKYTAVDILGLGIAAETVDLEVYAGNSGQAVGRRRSRGFKGRQIRCNRYSRCKALGCKPDNSGCRQTPIAERHDTNSTAIQYC